MTHILITGGRGRLGRQLTERLQHNTAYTVDSTDYDTLDVTDFAAVRDHMVATRPDVVLHAAAWTDVDGCATDPDRAMVVNGLAAGNVAAAATVINAAVLYVSSNEVFDGQRADAPYYEYDPRHPANPYGYSKYVGECEVERLNPKHYIVRTSWLFAHGGKNFMQSMINAAAAGRSLRVVTNEIAHPTYTNDLADAILHLIQTRRYGTYHLVNTGAASRWDFARYILDRAGYTATPIERISQSQWPRPSTPPAYTRLANIAGAHLGIRLRPWQQAVDAFLQCEGLLADAHDA